MQNQRVVSYISDFVTGFFVLPFVFFTISMTIKIINSPQRINEGEAIIYVVLITGFMYFLRMDVIFSIENGWKSWLLIVIGFLIFVGLWISSV